MNRNALSLKAIGARLRYARVDLGFSLEKLADHLAKSAGSRPSIAKLSRIETGLQPVPIDILPGLSELTGIPKSELRPDLVAYARSGRMSGFVYAIGDETGRVKIGWSRDPLRRLNKIGSDCSFVVTLLGIVPATREQEAEIQPAEGGSA